MKKIILLFSVVLMGLASSFAQTNVPADFSASCPSGQVLYYKIIDYGEVNVWFQNEYPEMLGGHIKIPRTVRYEGQNYVVTGIADSTFINCIRIQGIEMPTTMFYVGNSAFQGCTDLRVVEMPKTLTSIGEQAFQGCTSLIDVVMPNGVVELGAYAFKDCTNVRHFVISHSLPYIPEGCFENCAAVTDYMIPASVDTIYCNAFAGYVSLKGVTFLGSNPPALSCPESLAFSRSIPIYVRRRSFDDYKASYIWGQYPIKNM